MCRSLFSVFALKAKHFAFAGFLHLLPLHNFSGIRSKKHFTDHRTANTIQLRVAIKGIFSGLFFF